MASIFIRMKIIATLSPFIDHYTVSTTTKKPTIDRHTTSERTAITILSLTLCAGQMYILYSIMFIGCHVMTILYADKYNYAVPCYTHRASQLRFDGILTIFFFAFMGCCMCVCVSNESEKNGIVK